MSDASDTDAGYPRSLGEREREWCAYLLPRDRAAYAPLAAMLDERVVLGHGRWGEGDIVMGMPGQTIDLEAPMEPVAAYGEIGLDDGHVLSISIHQPDDDQRIETHFSGAPLAEAVEHSERGRWCYSYWRPGDPSPGIASGPDMATHPRQVVLDERGELVLAVDAARRTLWLHDATNGGNTLIPVTNFYNELMLLKGVRDPQVALEHRRLFESPSENSDAELRGAFTRYNVTWRKVDADRLGDGARPGDDRGGLVARIARALRGGGAR